MKKIAILVETRRGKIKPSLYGVITAAQGAGHELFGLVFDRDPTKYADQLANFGIHQLVAIAASKADLAWNAHSRTGAIIEAMDHFNIHTLLALTSMEGKDLLPRVAARLDAPLIMDCLAVDLTTLRVDKPQFSGKTIATIQVTGDHHIFGIRPNVIDPKPMPVRTKISFFQFDEPDDGRFEVREMVDGKEGDTDLSEAEIIISGGRGMQNGKNFEMLRACARTMGAAVGASRAAVDAGWVPHVMQVGQTGATVGPKLYIACGISGSVQHLAGMKTSGTIVCINTDPDAAMMRQCDYGIVGDLFEIVPLLTRQLEDG